MPKPFLRLGGLPLDEFLSDYWQQRPVVLRGCVPLEELPTDGAGVQSLACREDADSRLIVGVEHPELYYGPFEPVEFEDLPEQAWTVLVQEVDRLSPRGAALMDRFRFLPNWRMDDLMASYALPGAGVGAHIDQYDVFLVQGQGSRRWEFGSQPIDSPDWRSDTEVAILREFEPDHAEVLHPGDVLYLPPRVAHNGVALEPCVTFSVGFRAPSISDLLTGAASLAAEVFSDAERYEDPSPNRASEPGRLDASSMRRLRSMLRRALGDDDRLDEWIGRLVTESPRGFSGTQLEEDLTREGLLEILRAGAVLRPAGISRFAYRAERGQVTLFAGGEAFDFGSDEAAARTLTGFGPLDASALGPLLVADSPIAASVLWLVGEGLLLIERPS